jgi:hypothetical protein
MAFRDVVHDPTFQVPKHRDNLFYNTDGYVAPPTKQNTSVRFGDPNRPDDVELVQYFLKKIAANPSKFNQPFRPPRSHPVMKVDGTFGEITRTWIEEFQLHLARIGRRVRRDGVVDRIQGGHVAGPNGFLFTLVVINTAFGQVVGEDGWDTWWKAADVPPRLKAKIRDPASFL